MLTKILLKTKFPFYIQYMLNYFFIKKYNINIEYNYNIKKFKNLLEILQQTKKFRYSINPYILISPIEGKIINIKYGINNICIEFKQNINNNHVVYTPIDSILLSVENEKNKKIINFLIKNTDIKYRIIILSNNNVDEKIPFVKKKEFKKSEAICNFSLFSTVYISFNSDDIELLNYIGHGFVINLGIGIAKLKKRKINAKNRI